MAGDYLLLMYLNINSGYGNNNSYGTSGLEHKIAEYSVELPGLQNQTMPTYIKNSNSNISYDSYNSKTVVDEQPVTFLNPQRPPTPFIGDAAQLSEPIKQTFSETTKNELPRNITITVSSREELVKKNLGFLNNSVVGLSKNNEDSKDIFVVAGDMDAVMLTIGHELGHVIKKPAKTAEEEEAKAFAFEAAWAKTIFTNDIAGLRSSINSAVLSPAKNGLHDVAFNFVKNNINSSEPLQLFNSISRGEINAQQIFEGTMLQPTITTIAAIKSPQSPLYSLPQQNKTRLYGGYRNKSRVQNLPPPHNFFWSDLGKGIYGLYIPLTKVEMINEQLLRKDIEQLHKTLGHEYSLHHVMGLPDGYVVEALEEAMFWTAEDDDKYYPKKD